ncbi:MAG: methionine biosynthesis protein MetW [Spirochaetales bacterium]|jgi:methionine biosynthesis protein MetW|nr:methionine biosynthesis protein MetW [Spirochaetales bacterium]
MPKSNDSHIRFDLKVIASWIEKNARILDLGCGEGDLLVFLKKHKDVRGTGIDQKEENVSKCVEKGLSVIQGDINEEVRDYPPHSFDYVILSQTLQQVYAPSDLIWSLLEIGKKVIVSFPNFSHWRIRYQILFSGYVPVTPELPYEWYNTPNIRVITMNDFRKYARQIGFQILKEAAINTNPRRKSQGKIMRWFPDLFAAYGIFLISNKK